MLSLALTALSRPQISPLLKMACKIPDFAITGGTCTTGVAYASGKSCLENVSFTPNSVGSISAKLLMLDAKSNILASMVLHGVGMGANIQATPGTAVRFGLRPEDADPSGD